MFVLAVLLDGFYAAAHADGGPLVVHHEKKVLDANPEARERGVTIGMPLAEARSVLADDGRFVLWESETYAPSQKRWLDVVAEHSDVVEPLRQHETLADLAGHPRPREVAEKIKQELEKAGFSPRVGIAPCRWVARLAARRGDPIGLALADPKSYVSDLPVASLPIPPEVAGRLDLLGYRTAGDLARVPLDVLRAQFGARADGVSEASLGRGNALVRPLFPEDAVAARFAFEGEPPDSTQALDAALGWLASRLGPVLRDRDVQGRAVELFLEHEDGSVTKLERTFADPIDGERDVANAMRLMLSPLPPRPVLSVRVRLPSVRNARRVQLDLHGGRSGSDREEGIRIALTHVRDVYGEASVRLVSEIAEPRRTRVRRAYREINDWAWG